MICYSDDNLVRSKFVTGFTNNSKNIYVNYANNTMDCFKNDEYVRNCLIELMEYQVSMIDLTQKEMIHEAYLKSTLVSDWIDFMNYYEDHKKCKYYLENKDNFYTAVNYRLIIPKLAPKIKQILENEIDINSISNISIKDLKLINKIICEYMTNRNIKPCESPKVKSYSRSYDAIIPDLKTTSRNRGN